jgi:hypothetical protein
MWEISPQLKSPKNDDPSLWELIHAKPARAVARLGKREKIHVILSETSSIGLDTPEDAKEAQRLIFEGLKTR